ncbi:MAG: hypothetical protein ACP5GD_00280 [Candidatus Micrarchaeia archaeon]|jgi:hypothetical protein
MKPFITMITLALLLGFASAQINGALSIANLAVTPNPAIAGSNITIIFQLYNSYDNSLKNINMHLEGTYPLLNFSPSGTYEISSVGQGLSEIYTYTLHIPKTAQEGTYTLNLVATYETASPIIGGSEEIGSSIMPITIFIYNFPNITINAAMQAIPGSEAQAGITISNVGYGNARNVHLILLNSTYFTPLGAKSFSLGTVPPSATLQQVAQYYVSRNITSGEHRLAFLVNYTTDTNQTISRLVYAYVEVKINKPAIKVNVASAQPQTLSPGYNQTVMLSIQNTGTGIARNITISLYPGNGTVLLSSIRNYFISSLEPSAVQQIPVLVGANGGAGKAEIIANVTYYSANYDESFASRQLLNLTLFPIAQFTIIGEKSALYPGATDVPVTLEVENTGNEEADNIQFSMQSVYPISPIASTYYLAKLMPGQIANITFLASADSQGEPGSYPITVFAEWKQPNGAINQEYTGTINYFATVSATASNGSLYDGLVIIAIVVIVLAYAALKAHSKARRKR